MEIKGHARRAHGLINRLNDEDIEDLVIGFIYLYLKKIMIYNDLTSKEIRKKSIEYYDTNLKMQKEDNVILGIEDNFKEINKNIVDKFTEEINIIIKTMSYSQYSS